MNEGVQILIDRMESNPEDFETRFEGLARGAVHRGRFVNVGEALSKRLRGEPTNWHGCRVLTTEELSALDAAYLKMERKRFTERIMADLLSEPEKIDEYAYPQGVQVSSGFFTTVGTSGPSLTTVANTSAVPSKAAYGSVVIQPSPNGMGPKIDFNDENITTINEMIEAWRKHD